MFLGVVFLASGIIVNLLWCILYRLVLFRILFTPSSYAAVQLLRSSRSALIGMHLKSRKGLVNRMAFQMQLVVLKCFLSSKQACYLWICVCDMSVYFTRRVPMAVLSFTFFWWARGCNDLYIRAAWTIYPRICNKLHHLPVGEP